jgi:hypothetical protein
MPFSSNTPDRPPGPEARRTAQTKVVPTHRITVLPAGQSSKFQSTLPATRSADIKPESLATASVGLLVFGLPERAHL